MNPSSWNERDKYTERIENQPSANEVIFAMFVNHGQRRFIILKVFWSHRIGIIIEVSLDYIDILFENGNLGEYF